MKKFSFKTRAQWGFFKAALFGTVIGLLIAPTAKNILEGHNISGSDGTKTEENAISAFIHNISFGEKTKVIINGDVVAISKGREAGEAAFKAARLAYNKDGVKLLHLDVSYEPVDEEQDRELLKEMRPQKGEALVTTILERFPDYDEEKKLAYTMRIEDYTVTVEHFQDVIAMLEQAQSRYDENDRFQVGLNPPASRNVAMYEVSVSEKTARENPAQPDAGQEEGTTSISESSENVYGIAPVKAAMTGEEAGEQSAAPSGATEGDSQTGEPQATDSPEDGETSETAGSPEEPQEAAEKENQQLAAQAADDGVKYVGFAEKIQVMETYVPKEQVKDKDIAYNEITEEKGEAGIYVVQPGDHLDLIAEKTNMTVEEIKELNPGIESNENLYYDDRLNITVPRAAVQIMVQKQETYEESYNEDIVYEDDGSMYIGENVVLEEGSAGRHIVTDLVTYNGEMESGREQLAETVEVAAVAQVVLRGTKSRPTYMYPVTNWVVTSNFGYRWGRLHAGTDVGVPTGTTVRASRGGQITVAGWLGGYGNCVMIDHGDGITTVYGHLSEINCSVGQYVDQGQQIALSGNTGRSTGPHLHFEIRVNGVAEDATPYLEGRK